MPVHLQNTHTETLNQFKDTLFKNVVTFQNHNTTNKKIVLVTLVKLIFLKTPQILCFMYENLMIAGRNIFNW